MFNMITLERNRAGHHLGHIGQDASQAVCCRLFEKQFMGAFVDHHEQRMICKRSQEVCSPQYDPPRLVPYQPCHSYLERYETQDGPKCFWIFTDQATDFRMLF